MRKTFMHWSPPDKDFEQILWSKRMTTPMRYITANAEKQKTKAKKKNVEKKRNEVKASKKQVKNTFRISMEFHRIVAHFAI